MFVDPDTDLKKLPYEELQEMAQKEAEEDQALERREDQKVEDAGKETGGFGPQLKLPLLLPVASPCAAAAAVKRFTRCTPKATAPTSQARKTTG